MDKRIQYFICLCLLCALHYNYAQLSGDTYIYRNLPEINPQETARDSLILFKERVLLHLASDHLTTNETLFLKAYILTGPDQNLSSVSKVLNLELLDQNGSVLKNQLHKIIGGMVDASLSLPDDISPGQYYVKAYTRWMQNYIDDYCILKPIIIGDAMTINRDPVCNSELSVYPEGGTQINGYENKIVIKVPYGLTNKTAKIVDNQENEVTTVNYYSPCIGMAIYKPIKGRQYKVEFGDGSTYALPPAEDQGYLLQVNNLSESRVKVQITAPEGVHSEVKIVGISNGIQYFQKTLDFNRTNSLEMEFSKKSIPRGMLYLKLYDGAGTALASRPIWIDGKMLHITIEPVDSGLEQSVYEVKVKDENDIPVKAKLAVSVSQLDADSYVDSHYNIIGTNLTAMQVITGDKKDIEARRQNFLTDLNVLVSDMASLGSATTGHTVREDIEFPIQNGLEFSGYAYDLNNNLLTNTQIQVMAQSEEGYWFGEADTDSKGFFKLGAIQITGKSKLIFRTEGNNTKSRIIKVIPSKEEGLESKSDLSVFAKNQKKNSANEITPLVSDDNKPSLPFDVTGLIELEEVEVNDTQLKTQKTTPSVYGIEVPETHIKYQDPARPMTFDQLLSGIPGVIVSGSGLNVSVGIPRATGPVLWVLDGYPLPQEDFGPTLGGFVPTRFSEIQVLISELDVERIEVLIGADAAIYGTRAAGGVIAIYTRSGKDLDYISRTEGTLNFDGYEVPIEFDEYYEKLPENIEEKASLLYWNPELETDENGTTTIEIPQLSDKFKVEVSSITSDGKVGSSIYYY